jgi:AcrR family transcriptional regulator
MASTPRRASQDATAAPTATKRPPLRTSAKAVATRAALIELAAQLFSTQGYLQTSIRDIARDANLTTGAIYGHFRNKAELLAEAISSRTATELEAGALFGDGTSHIDTLRNINARYPQRRELRALILQGAAAALTDAETRDRLRDEQLAHLDDWAARYDEHRERLGIDATVDVHDALLYTWAAEVGLGVLEAFGIEPRSKKSWGDMAARFGRSMTLPPEPAAPKKRKVRRHT